MICEQCGKVPATQAQTIIENGTKRVHYRCDACADLTEAPPQIRSALRTMWKKKGEIKLTRVRPQRRVVTYICQDCAAGR